MLTFSTFVSAVRWCDIMSAVVRWCDIVSAAVRWCDIMSFQTSQVANENVISLARTHAAGVHCRARVTSRRVISSPVARCRPPCRLLVACVRAQPDADFRLRFGYAPKSTPASSSHYVALFRLDFMIVLKFCQFCAARTSACRPLAATHCSV